MTEQPPQQPPYQHPYPAPFNVYAILSLVFAVAVLPPLGVYFGYKAKQQIAQTGERGVELAQAGLIVGWVFTAFCGLFMLAWCAMAAVFFGSALAGR